MPMRKGELLYNVFKYQSIHLQHYGTPGQKWGVRHWQNADGTYNEDGLNRYFRKKTKNPKGTVFISGSSKTQFDDNPFHRYDLHPSIKDQINKYMKQGKTILVGDAPGIDRQVQDYLKDHNYNNVEVYSPGTEVRYNANPQWKTNLVDVPGAEKGSGEWLAGKDKAMSDRADEGLAIVIEDGAQATRNNITRLEDQNKKCNVFQLNKDGEDGWVKLGDFDEKTLSAIRRESYDKNHGENEHESDISYLNNISNHMQEDFSYDSTDHKLQTPIQTFKSKSGNCHDQTLFEKELFEQMGMEPKAIFVMEVDPKTGQGGTTHSFVYFQDEDGHVQTFENAWKSKAGVDSYNTINQMKKHMEWEHKNKNNFGDYQIYPELVWGEFKAEPGDDLQDIINKSLS